MNRTPSITTRTHATTSLIEYYIYADFHLCPVVLLVHYPCLWLSNNKQQPLINIVVSLLEVPNPFSVINCDALVPNPLSVINSDDTKYMYFYKLISIFI